MSTREELWNPAQVEEAIREVSDEIANSVNVCGELYEAYLKADREYDYHFARAYLRHDGPAHEKGHYAQMSTTNLRAVRDTADAAYKLADRRAKALTEKLRALQSVGASIRMQYGVAGRGEY